MPSSDAEPTDQPRTEQKRRLGSRARAVVAVFVLLAAGVSLRKTWDTLYTALIHSPRFQLTAEVLHALPDPPPAWIRTDVKAEVLHDSDISRSVTLLDDAGDIQRRLIDAFELHPWVRRVERIEFASPSRIEIELEYREPVAVAEVTVGKTVELLPLDAEAVRLPDEGLTEVEKNYFPRIGGVEGRPMVGEAWTDERTIGGVKLALQLRDVWESYSLLEIVPSSYPEVQRSHRFYTYEILSSGGTRIVWGAAPNQAPPGESSFEDKLARLASYINNNGPLNSIDSPQSIDVRNALHIEERTVKHEDLGEVVR